ncbi:P-II family nitrogen regulator [Cupriavidus necator]
MKQVIVVLPPHRLESVEAALHEVDHLPGFTLFHARGHPRGTGQHHAFTGSEWNPDAHDQVVLLIFCADEHLEGIVGTIRAAAYTGNRHDGLIAISDLEDILRIRTGERGDAAV